METSWSALLFSYMDVFLMNNFVWCDECNLLHKAKINLTIYDTFWRRFTSQYF